MRFSSYGNSVSLVPEITNQHEERDMDPFPLVMFVSFDAGELFISVNPKLHSNSKAETPASKCINIMHTVHTHTAIVWIFMCRMCCS